MNLLDNICRCGFHTARSWHNNICAVWKPHLHIYGGPAHDDE